MKFMYEPKFHIGNNIDVLDDLHSEGYKANVAITSPPYNVGIKYDTHKDYMGREEYEDFTYEWAKAVYKVTADDGWLFLNYGERLEDLFFSHDMAKQVIKVGWYVKNRMTWLRRNPAYHSHFGNLTQTTEFVWMFSKKEKIFLPHRYEIGTKHVEKDFYKRKYPNRKFYKGFYVRDRGNFWLFYENEEGDVSDQYHATDIFESHVVMKNQSTNQPWEAHPARFPLVLPTACISISTKEGDEVLDPFAGTGTTSYAARAMKRSSTGIDISEKYINDARQRMISSDETLPSFLPRIKKKRINKALF